MSQPATESPARSASPPSPGGQGFFARKYGPLPAWGWILLAAAGAGAYLWYRNYSGANAATAAASTGTGTGTGTDDADQLATIQTEIQDLEGEVAKDDGGGTKGKKYTRHTSTGKESLDQIAKAKGTSVAKIVSDSEAGGEDKANLDKLHKWASHPRKREKGVVYYT